jgi:DNA-binding transcriptional ArsR family regulator
MPDRHDLLFRALADPTRRALFERLCRKGEQLGALAPLIDWTSQMAGFWQSRFDQLEDLLKRMDQ